MSDIDILPPSSEEAELGILGCIMLDPRRSIDACLEFLKAGADAFYDTRCQAVYATMLEMNARPENIDQITLTRRLKDADILDGVGGVAFVATLPDTTPSAANLQNYIEIVRDKHILRQMITTSTELSSLAYGHTGNVSDLLGRAERMILKIGTGKNATNCIPMKEHCLLAIDRAEKANETKGLISGIKTGLKTYDEMTLGLVAGDVLVIAARPSLGKSSLAYNIADNVASAGTSVGFISLEMKATQLIDRHISSRARIDSRKIRSGTMTEGEQVRFAKAVTEIVKLPIHIDDERGVTASQIAAKMRRLKQAHGCKVFVIDYLQLISSTSFGSRNQAVAEISSALKIFAGEEDVSIILLSQLNRESQKGEKPRAPTMSELRESGQIEQDADQILLLWQPEESSSTPAEDEDDYVDIDAIVAKQRNGPKGLIKLRFHRRFTTFSERPKFDVSRSDHWYLPKEKETVDEAF